MNKIQALTALADTVIKYHGYKDILINEDDKRPELNDVSRIVGRVAVLVPDADMSDENQVIVDLCRKYHVYG